MTGRLTRILAAAYLAGAVASATAGEIGYIEDFALAAERETALDLLIPGSEEYYYYHCLHYQNIEQFDKVDALLKVWIKRYQETPAVREIQNRQALLTYSNQPAESLEFIRQRLQLQFNHQRQALGEKPNFPTSLDSALIGRETLARRAFAQHPNLAGFESSALQWLIAGELNDLQRRHLLERLARPDHAQLLPLIVADLKARDSKPFGSMSVHNQLLLPQLDELLRLKPELLDETNFVNVYLFKLRPNDDLDWQDTPQVREAYLERLWNFVQRLAPVHNSLKAHVLYHRLVHDRGEGKYDKARFMTYIRLPRNAGYMATTYMQLEENRRFPADLNAKFHTTMLPVVGDDEPLVRSYLEHFFLTETTTKPYEPYINDIYLRHALAETKIVNGLGEPEQWYSLLPPEKYQALKERIDLDFAHTNATHFAAGQPVAIDLFVKNVKSLIVKVFEINTRNYYRQELREVNTDINLDGLVANEERVWTYDEPPLRRVSRHFEFPSLDRAGVYAIDFVGNGTISRVVVRKGRLRHLVRSSTAGHVFTVLDEANQVVKDATIWLAGHEYQADESGRVAVPFTAQANPTQPIVISQGDFSSLDSFHHQTEDYRLGAAFFVDRESLVRRNMARLVVRPALYVNDTPVTLSVLEDVRLTIGSVDLEGVTTSKVVNDFKLFEDRESVYEFRTPPRLAQVTFTLQARVQNLSQNAPNDLSVSESFTLNRIDQTEMVDDLHLAQIAGEYSLELLGKSGEAKPDRPVQLSIKHRDFTEPVKLTLQTDAAGRVKLGPLDDIDAVTATSPAGTEHTWSLMTHAYRYPSTVHAVAGQVIELPYLGSLAEPARDEFSLLESRGAAGGGNFTEDHFDALSIKNGMLRITGLARGDYDLLLKDSGQRIQLRLAQGQASLGYVLGDNRQLELRGQNPLQIAGVESGDEAIRIRLENANPYARVHVFATRYLPAFSPFAYLAKVGDSTYPIAKNVAKQRSLYMAGRNLGDELRYIISRGYARKFPGNMTENPSLLLNPWAIRQTQTETQEAAPGDAFGAAPDPQPAGDPQRPFVTSVVPLVGSESGFANLDFLAQPSTVLLNLVPDKQGVVTIARGDLGAHQHLHVVAIDPRTTAYRAISLPEVAADPRDLRLARGLDPKRHFTQQKNVTVVAAGDTFVLPDIATSRYETYDSLARVYSLYATLSGDARLAEFRFLLNWPKTEPDAKRELYSKYACHELNFFLFKKDPEFFAAVVQPFLKNKRDKTFLDRWLLGEDLARFVEPWNYARLNTVERILLSQRVAADRDNTVRHVGDMVALLPRDLDRFNLLFTTAIKGRALDAGAEVRLMNGQDAVMVDELDAVNGILDDRAMPRGSATTARPAEAPAKPGSGKDNLFGDDPFGADKNGDGRRTAVAKDAKGLQRPAMLDDFFAGDVELRQQARQLYRKLDTTQEWAENNYYQLPIAQQNADLVTVSGFWKDYAEHDPARPFQSGNLAEAARTFSEMMFALALLDLPFESVEHPTELTAAGLTVKAAGPMIVYHEEIRPAAADAQPASILVSQNFFRHGDRYRHENNQRLDKFVTDEFLVHTVYGCQVVVTNPTSSPQKLDVLLQIPVGALPVMSNQETRSVQVELQPYHTQTVEYHFYFPAAGRFPHYPVHVSRNEQLMAHAAPVTLHVVEQLSRVDRGSWEYVSQFGSQQDVLDFLRQNNLHRLDLDKIAFRMSDKQFFLTVTELLAARHAYNHTLWSYGIKHDAAAAVGQYLRHSDAFVQQCGAYLDSPLLVIDPVARRTYQHLDYRPLVNARAHQLGRRRQILNDALGQQYHQLLRILGYRRQLDGNDLLAVTYYMLLQDRIEEAIAYFDRIDVAGLETRLQYDYFAACLNLYREDVEAAREITAKYAQHPVGRWRTAFVALEKQLDEIEGAKVDVLDPKSRQQVQSQLASSEPGFSFKVESKQVTLDYQNLDRVQVNYYLMDIELLFSRNPFVQQHAGQFSHIRPNLTDSIRLPGKQNSIDFTLPRELHNKNVLVEIVGGGQIKSEAYYSNSLALQVIDNYGQLKITSSNPGKPLAKVYVKVYARMKDGSVRFYKDGYTDLRGRFDYGSLNTNELDFVDKFSLLVLSDEHGAVVREANPPKR